jgi:hypothetical protein
LIIVGAGMAGLLAANMLRHRDPIVVESQSELPNNHSAVLRFRSSVIGDLLGIPFKKVKVLRCVATSQDNVVAHSLAYSQKTLGVIMSDRSVGSVEAVDRYIAPPNLVMRMSRGIRIKCDTNFDFKAAKEKVISTVPMSYLHRALMPESKIHDLDFRYAHGFNISAVIESCDAYASVYVPDPRHPFSRVSITGHDLIIEYAFPGKTYDQVQKLAAIKAMGKAVTDDVEAAMLLLGLRPEIATFPVIRPQRFAKILPIDDRKRKAFIYWASTAKGIAYQLGRYATWRPGLLLDDLVNDVRTIDGWISQGEAQGYAMDIHEARQ